MTSHDHCHAHDRGSRGGEVNGWARAYLLFAILEKIQSLLEVQNKPDAAAAVEAVGEAWRVSRYVVKGMRRKR